MCVCVSDRMCMCANLLIYDRDFVCDFFCTSMNMWVNVYLGMYDVFQIYLYVYNRSEIVK